MRKCSLVQSDCKSILVPVGLIEAQRFFSAEDDYNDREVSVKDCVKLNLVSKSVQVLCDEMSQR